MSETKIEITVSGDNAAETVAQITQTFPDITTVEAAGESLPTTAGALLSDGLAASAALPGRIAAWAATMEMAPLLVILSSAAILLVVHAAEFAVGRVFLSAKPGGAAETRALRWGVVRLCQLVFFYVAGRIALTVVFPADAPSGSLALGVLAAVLPFRIWVSIIEGLTASADPTRRVTGLRDDEAAHIKRLAVIVMGFVALTGFGQYFVLDIVGAAEAGGVFALTMRILGSLFLVAFFLAVRRPVARLIRLGFASDPENPGGFLKTVSRFWPVAYVGLLALQVSVEARSYLSPDFDGNIEALRRSFGTFVLLPFLLAGLGGWRDSLLAHSTPGPSRGRIMGLFTLVEGAVLVAAAMFIMYAWNIDPFATDLTGAARILPGLVSAAVVTVVGISLWRVASAFLDDGKRASAEGGPPDDEGGMGGSRMETVIPVLRAVVSAFIATVTVLLALSALGVQIAPLLAGAGILGIAIGFGAQKVVEDLISGVLYLVEDAFRKGEYIETSEGKGVVEAISLRSVRLRHHLGPVFTIPYSSMGTIQNHSRDWVTVKLKFEVAPDQDLEKVRKLIKKVGQELLEDPELEGQFLAPLKSQGAVALVGSNYQIGVKFTSEPGKQFLIRRKALSAIQKAFRENGIEMSPTRVVVDSGDHSDAAAAAKVVADAKAAHQPGA
jgi:small-conductance mechanosensitive channel